MTALPLEPIRSDAHLADAQAVLDVLLRQSTCSAAEVRYLDALSDLVGEYENAHHPISPPSEAEMREFRRTDM